MLKANFLLIHNIDDKIQKFNNMVLNLFNNLMPLKTPRIALVTIEKSIFNVETRPIYGETENNPTSEKCNEYRNIRNFTSHAIMEQKISYFNIISRDENRQEL